MRRAATATMLGLGSLIVVLTGGCSGGSATTTTNGNEPKEVAQKLPKLPPGWRAHRDRSVGYEIGVPPGWQLSDRGGRILIRAPDHLIAVTLTADRGARTFAIPVGHFATQALGALPGFKVPLKAGRPKPVHGMPLDGVAVTATGKQASGLRERATLIVLRRDRLVNYSVAVLENARQQGSESDRRVALRMVRTLRDVPPKARTPKRGGSG